MMVWVVILWVGVSGTLASGAMTAVPQHFRDPRFSIIPRPARFAISWAVLFIVPLFWPLMVLVAIARLLIEAKPRGGL